MEWDYHAIWMAIHAGLILLAGAVVARLADGRRKQAETSI